MSDIPPKPRSPSGSVERRTAGAPPSLGRVNRLAPGQSMHGRSRRSRRRRRYSGRRHSSTQRRSSVLTHWLLLLVGLVGLSLVGMATWSLFHQKDAGTVIGRSHVTAAPRFNAQDAVALAERLLESPGADELAGILRPGAIPPEQAAGMLASIVETELTDKRPVWMGSVDSLSVPVEAVVLATHGSTSRYVLMTPDAEGNWRIDFDAFARLCQPPIASFRDEDPPTALVRVLCAEAPFYQGHYGDEEAWHCFELRHPDLDHSLYGYCRRDSPQDNAMLAIQKRGEIWADDRTRLGAPGRSTPSNLRTRVTLRLRHPEEAGRHQFEITSVVADDWVVSDIPVDQRLAQGEP